MDNSCDICRTEATLGSYTELLQNMGLPPLICKRCQFSLNLPLSFQLCVCVWKCLQGKVGSRYSVELFSALEMLPARFL